MHHLLIEPGHRDGDEHPGKYLFQEKFAAIHFGGENSRKALRVQLHQTLPDREMQSVEHIVHADHQAREHAGRLQCIRPDNRFDATFVGIKHNHDEDDQGSQPERYVQAIENSVLQYLYHQIQARRGTECA